LINYCKSHAPSAFGSLWQAISLNLNTFIEYPNKDIFLIKLLSFMNSYMTLQERYFGSITRHVDSYLISPVEIDIKYSDSKHHSTNHKVQISINSQIFNLRFAISSIFKVPSHQFENFHQGELIQDQDTFLETTIPEDNRIVVILQNHYFGFSNYESSLIKVLFSNPSLNQLFEELENPQ
jgi:hypothetical protein